MKKSELYKAVKSAVELSKTEGAEINKDVLAGQLMGMGASLAMVARELPKALKENGIVTAVNTGSEELAKVRAAIKAALKNKKAKGKEGEEGYVPAQPARVVDTYKDLREWAEELEDEFAITSEAAIKAIKSQLKELGKETPTKAKLGVVKEGIVAYFAHTPSNETSLEGLAKFLHNIAMEDGTEMDKEKALHAARMNYTFAKMIKDGVTIHEVN